MENSLKDTARKQRGTGIRCRVENNAHVPSNWENFLKLESNKTELYHFLTNVVITAHSVYGKHLLVTSGESLKTCSEMPMCQA